MHHPYHHQPSAAIVTPDIDPEAIIARQEAMIQAGTHAMIAEKLARDAVCNQALREQHAKPVVDPAPVITPAAIIPDVIV